ncbi:cell division protein ZapD [Aliikangiella sp. IMCC44359]|uniref:cell division protein ZapD n=1 Tax=Aliikangiella sp. IMCC44359 TaxID=3459125 RepID=UPI00403ACA6E
MPTTNHNDDKPKLIFEYPAKPQIRSFLRLEALFQQFERNRLATHKDNHYYALKILFEILEILEHGDTRSELTKELSRLADQFTNLKQSPEVDLKKLDNFLVQINQLKQWVFNYEGKFGDKLRKHSFIENVKHRTSIPGGACQFDSPELFLFLNKDFSFRQQQLQSWIESIKGIKTSVEVILKISRDTTQWKTHTAPMGTYLIETADISLQLIRVRIPNENNLFPEFSCGKHRSTIIFKYFDEQHKKTPFQEPIDFELACCL